MVEFDTQDTVISLNAASSFHLKSAEDSVYYTFLRDANGNCSSFFYNNSYSDLPFSGFTLPLTLPWINIVQEAMSLEVDKVSNEPRIKEYLVTDDCHKGEQVFQITVLPILIAYKNYHHIIISKRPNSNTDKEVTELNQLLNNEVSLNKINSKCISSVSHDFRTPLSIIYANLQLLEYHEFQLDQETIEDAFSLSRMAVKTLLRVLDKVSVIDSLNKGRLEYKPQDIELHSLCSCLVKELSDAEVIPDRVEYRPDPMIKEVHIDEYLFTNLFTHLIHNALNYSRKNHKVIFESKYIDEHKLRFTITDNGIGIPQKQIENLRTFFEGPRVDLVEGIGLGLAIVKECLTLHHGSIHINSEVGKGSVFTVDLPLIWE